MASRSSSATGSDDKPRVTTGWARSAAAAAAEQPGLEVYEPPSFSAAAAQRRDEQAKAAPEPYLAWSDAASGLPPSAYTFYREPTPPPPEERLGHGKYLGEGLVLPPHTSPPPDFDSIDAGDYSAHDEEEDAGICGIRRRVFRGIITAIVILLVTVSIGVGVGVGLSRTRATGTAAASSSSNGSTTTSPTPTTSGPMPSSTALPIPLSDCPAVNGTVYRVPNSDKRFLRMCGVDYSGLSGAVDIKQVPTGSFADCMNNCAGTVGCSGCSWGIVQGDKPGPEHRCWIKSTLQRGHAANDDFCFGILM